MGGVVSLGYVDEIEGKKIVGELQEIGKMINGFIRKLGE